MIFQIAVMRRKKIQTGRGSTKDVLNKDWSDLRQMEEERSTKTFVDATSEYVRTGAIRARLRGNAQFQTSLGT